MNTSILIPQIVVLPEASTIDNNLLLELLQAHKSYLESILASKPYDISIQNIKYLEQKIARLFIKISAIKHQLNKEADEQE